MIRSFKKKLWIGISIVLLLIISSLFGVFRFEIDVALTLWAIVGFIGAYSLFLVVDYLIRPSKLVTITTRVELRSPSRLLKSVQNYRLFVRSEKHFEEKGKERTIKMDELFMSFNSSDHPDAYAYCMQVISTHMEACVENAKLTHPNAVVIGSPLSLPPEIKLLDN